MSTTDQSQIQVLLSGIPEVKAAYFQAPPATAMVYPCILYSLDTRESLHADNAPYRKTKRYQVTVMDRDPTSTIPDAVQDLPLSSFERRYVVEGLYHDIFNIYF